MTISILPQSKSHILQRTEHSSLTHLYLLIISFAICQGLAISYWGIKGIILIIGAGYFYFLMRWPHIALIMTIIVIFDGFGLINPETFYRMPGVFKIKDLLFLSLFIPLLISRKWQYRFNIVYRNYHKIFAPILFILFLAALQMIRTSLNHGLPLSSCVMAGRHYWYYSFAFLTAIYLDSLKKRKTSFDLFIIITVILAIIVIIQTIMLSKGWCLLIHYQQLLFQRICEVLLQISIQCTALILPGN